MRVDESSNSHSHLTANSHGLSSILERSHQLWTHVCSATLINCHGFSFSFDRAHESWTKLSPKSGHSTLIQLSSSFDCVHESLNSHTTLILVWPRARDLNKSLIQTWSLNSHTTLILVWLRAWELNETLTQIWSLSSYTTLILVWPRARESNETLIQIWSINSHTTLILVWLRAWELNETLTQIWSLSSYTTLILTRLTARMRIGQNSHPNLVTQLLWTLILVWLRAWELNKCLIQIWSLN